MISTIPELNIHTLGTGGGPIVSSSRAGTSTAITISGNTYVVDCGMGSVRNFRPKQDWGALRGIFLTHLHSDHIYDLGSFLVTGWEVPGESFTTPVKIFGPGKPPEPPALDPVHAGQIRERLGEREMTGTKEIVDGLLDKVYSSDIVVRMIDEGRSEPHKWVSGEDIVIPDSAAAHPVTARCPEMEPFEVYRDEHVVVSAILVDHRLCYPAFGYRFDTAAGSVVVSGDTAFSGNVVRLARGADVLLHEVMDLDAILATLPEGPTRMGIEGHLRESHTSYTEVGKVAAAAGVGKLILHHIVPNTPGTADLEKMRATAAEDFGGEVVVAEDNDVFEVAYERAN